jgi:DNA polymerase III epsilon subunit-like protein
MNYIVLDLEWNQSGCTSDDMPVDGLPFEIIEIGAVKLNENREYVDEFHQIIRPNVYSHIHHITGVLTNITMDELQKGKPFADVCDSFIKWCGDSFIFCTWGLSDITELQRNMNYYGIPLLPYPVYYYDLQKIYSLIFEDGKTRRSLDYVVNFFNISLTYGFHRAIYDARYTADIFRLLDMNVVSTYYSIDTYQIPTTKKNEIYAVYDDEKYNSYSKYISRGFKDKTLVMSDKIVTTTPCYRCGKKLKKKIHWFSCNSKIYYCLAYCPEHGYLKGKIRIKKHDNGLYFASKTLKLTDEDGAAKIYEKQAEIRKKRREKRHAAKAEI